MDVYVGQNGAVDAGDKECLPGPGWRRGDNVYRGIVESLGKGFFHTSEQEGRAELCHTKHSVVASR